MLVVEKVHHIKAVIEGINSLALAEIIKKSLPSAIIYDEVPDEELTEQTTRSMGKAAREQLFPGEMLKFARLDAGLSQTKLAALTGVGNRSGIALMEAGTRPISDKMAGRLAGHLMVSPEILKTSFYPRFTEITL